MPDRSRHIADTGRLVFTLVSVIVVGFFTVRAVESTRARESTTDPRPAVNTQHAEKEPDRSTIGMK